METNERVRIAILKDLATDKNISIAKLIEYIKSVANPDELVKEIDAHGDGILHLLISRYDSIDDQDCFLDFIRTYSQSINPNRIYKDENSGISESILHRLAKKDLPELTNFLLCGQCNFAEKPNLYSVDSEGKLPNERAGVNTSPLFKAALKGDFVERVILVQSWAPNSIFNYLLDSEQYDLLDYDSPQNSVVNALAQKEGLISSNGTIGGHLDFANSLYNDSFVDRPHTHWAWNSLCHANTGGAWEDAPVAVLEPLSSFANVEGITPYDTTIMGPHRLSDKATILVPQADIERVSARLKEDNGTFRGQVKGYDSSRISLREAVRAEISSSYPNAAKLLNDNSQDISDIVIDSQGNNAQINDYSYVNGGYFNSLSIEIDGVARPLMTGRDTVSLCAYEEYSQGRYIGTHKGSVTDIEKNAIFITLKNVSKEPAAIPANLDNLIGKEGVKNINNLCSVNAYRIYQELLAYDPNTGTHDFAEYLLKKAIIADFRAYHYQNNNQANPLSAEQLKSMVDDSYKALKAALGNITTQTPDLSTYRAVLQETHAKVLTPPKIMQKALKFSIWTKEPSQLSKELAKEIEQDKEKNDPDDKSGEAGVFVNT